MKTDQNIVLWEFKFIRIYIYLVCQNFSSETVWLKHSNLVCKLKLTVPTTCCYYETVLCHKYLLVWHWRNALQLDEFDLNHSDMCWCNRHIFLGEIGPIKLEFIFSKYQYISIQRPYFAIQLTKAFYVCCIFESGLYWMYWHVFQSLVALCLRNV